MSNMHVKSGDTVMVITGADAGKKGKVQKAFPETGRVIVEGVNIVKKQAPISASNVMIVCPKCGKPTRVGHKFNEGDGKLSRRKVRICTNTVNGVKCGASLDN